VQRKILVDLDPVTGQFYPLITAFGSSLVLATSGYTTSVDGAPFVYVTPSPLYLQLTSRGRERPPEILLHDGGPGIVTNKQVLAPASDVYSFSLILLLVRFTGVAIF
jgi:hypothetical protein